MIRRAFTLIELLVVIAIIAILAAILFPVFAQAKESAKDTSNLNNLKQTGLAILMYSTDYEDVFPLAQRYEPSYSALFGLATWQTEVQPYMKNWGILIHPKNGTGPSSPEAIKAWQQNLHYGVPPRATNLGAGEVSGARGYFMADTSVGSFARRVCGSQPCRYDGVFGNGCAVVGTTLQCPWWGGPANVASLSQTAISNVADQLLATEGAMWDLWMGFSGLGNPCTYGVMWIPADQYNLMGQNQFNMACPHARKRPRPQSPDGSCPGGVCSGLGLGITNGMTTYVASDGHAVAQDFRGQIFKNMILPDGTRVAKGLWPQGGW